jgi:DNA-binding LacI/PurR family transcriptional regulator
MALVVIRAVEAANRRVPDDVAVIGFDDLTWTALHRPALSSSNYLLTYSYMGI